MSASIAAVGDAVPDFTRHLDVVDLVAYAGATWDWHRLHHDPAFLERHGLPGPVVDGQVFGAYLVEQVQDWAGPTGRVVTTDFRFRRMVFAGSTVEVAGEVTAVEEVAGGDAPADGGRRRVTVTQTITCAGETVVTGATVVEVPA